MSNDSVRYYDGILDLLDTSTQMTPYAYEVTTNRGDTYLVYANSTEYDNAVMFGYTLKPLYQEVV